MQVPSTGSTAGLWPVWLRSRPGSWPAGSLHCAGAPPRRARQLVRGPRRSVAILVPLWHGHGVICQMTERNHSAILYCNDHNSSESTPARIETVRAVAAALRDHCRVQRAMCPHDGLTSLGDCLNLDRPSHAASTKRHNILFRAGMTTRRPGREPLRCRPHDRPVLAPVCPGADPVLPLATPPRERASVATNSAKIRPGTSRSPAFRRISPWPTVSAPGSAWTLRSSPSCAEDSSAPPSFSPKITRQVSKFAPPDTASRPAAPRRSGACATREFPGVPTASVRRRCRWLTGIALQGGSATELAAAPALEVPARPQRCCWKPLAPADNLLLT
jgi:adsorption protein B